ncbi:MAG TPA: hypothetical protein VGQ20_12235 [Acidimicrobiales bacterium]|nr:hypothetical protein [Acidimicrobiales bacterium]
MTTTDGAPTELSPRLQEFQTEVDQLKVTGGKANPERSGKIIGVLLQLIGLLFTVIAYFQSHGTKNALTQRDAFVEALIGMSLVIIGTGMFVVFTLTRYFRYWLVRLIYEQRDQTDRVISGR